MVPWRNSPWGMSGWGLVSSEGVGVATSDWIFWMSASGWVVVGGRRGEGGDIQ